MGFNQPAGLDRTRGYAIGVKDFSLTHLEEAYTTENWLVRVYRVINRNNRPAVKYADRQVKSKRSRSASKKV
jgi:dolichyl-diphosphooligosaccharide--protein glycosyltransferase